MTYLVFVMGFWYPLLMFFLDYIATVMALLSGSFASGFPPFSQPGSCWCGHVFIAICWSPLGRFEAEWLPLKQPEAEPVLQDLELVPT